MGSCPGYATVAVLEITYIFCNTHYFLFFNQMPRETRYE